MSRDVQTFGWCHLSQCLTVCIPLSHSVSASHCKSQCVVTKCRGGKEIKSCVFSAGVLVINVCFALSSIQTLTPDVLGLIITHCLVSRKVFN